MKTRHISGAEAIKALRQDLDMLMKGEWTPDDDSISASITMLDHIEAERAELLELLRLLSPPTPTKGALKGYVSPELQRARAALAKATGETL